MLYISGRSGLICSFGGSSPKPCTSSSSTSSSRSLRASPLASAAALTATGLSITSSMSPSSTTSFGLPAGGLNSHIPRNEDVYEVAVAGYTPTTLYMNKASLAECCTPNARWTSRDAILNPQTELVRI